MKNKILIILILILLQLFYSCSLIDEIDIYLDQHKNQRFEKRTDKLINKLHESVDTVYCYSGFDKQLLFWYHKDGYIYSFELEPYSTKKFKPVEAKNIMFDRDSLKIYFASSFVKDIKCFELWLGGETIKIYIKGRERVLFSGIQKDCLLQTKYPKNSFPYKLQYDFSIVLKNYYGNFNYDFEKMYSD